MRISRFICLILLLYSSSSHVYCDSEEIPLSLIMSQEEMKRLGLDTATSEQKVAFNIWLSQYTKTVIEQSSTYHPSKPIASWIQGWPKYALASAQEDPDQIAKERQKANMKIDKIRNEGEILELKDGSIWQVGVTYRFYSRLWTRGDTIEVTKSDNILLPYWVINITKDQKVQAKQLQAASPTGQKNPADPDYYKGATTVTQVRGKGEFIELENGSSWKIAPADQIRVKSWHKSDRVKVEKHDAFIYQYTIENLDNGDTALAKPNPQK